VTLQHRISGLPAVDKNGDPVGMVTEGDLLRREGSANRPRWLELLLVPVPRMGRAWRTLLLCPGNGWFPASFGSLLLPTHSRPVVAIDASQSTGSKNEPKRKQAAAM